jgi:hypothetical protein
MKHIAKRPPKRFTPATFSLLLAIAYCLSLFRFSVAMDSNPIRHYYSGSATASGIENQPLAFEPYTAENAPQVQFVSRMHGYTVFLDPREATVSFSNISAIGSTPRSNVLSFVRVTLSHSNPRSTPVPEELLPGKANYFLSNDPARWRTNVPLFAKIRYRSVYKDVDLVYYGKGKQLEYDFVVSPGGAPQSIGFSIEGAGRAEIEPGGDLLIEAGGKRIALNRPIAYQIIDNQRQEVAAHFVAIGGRRFGIQVGQYDHNVPLIIDPVLAYSTYLGGTGDEGIFGIDFDRDGNIYVAGETSSLDFPQKGGVQQHVAGSYDAFVSKFDPRGANLIYSTYLGGSQFDHAVGVKVDEHGDAYLAGITQSPDFPVTNAWQSSLGGQANGFVARLNSDGSELVFSTYFGGNGFDEITDFTTGPDKAVYVAGSTNSLNFPLTADAFQKQCDGGANPICIRDAFVAKFSADGRKLLYSTYLGGRAYDSAQALTVDDRGQVYVAGLTISSDFPVRNAYQSALSGPGDAFVTKFNAAGSTLVFSTFLGGTGSDQASGIALDSDRNVYVAGITSSTDFPLKRPFQSLNKGNIDGFVTKFDPEGRQLVYSTYLGGSGTDFPYRITVNRHQQAALIGFTSSTDFPTYRALFPSYQGGSTDAFIVLFDRSGQKPRFSTYLGGTGSEFGYAITIGCHNSIWVGGSTSSTDFPLTEPFQSAYAGGPFDAFLSRIKSVDGGSGSMPESVSMSDAPHDKCNGADAE